MTISTSICPPSPGADLLSAISLSLREDVLAWSLWYVCGHCFVFVVVVDAARPSIMQSRYLTLPVSVCTCASQHVATVIFVAHNNLMTQAAITNYHDEVLSKYKDSGDVCSYELLTIADGFLFQMLHRIMRRALQKSRPTDKHHNTALVSNGSVCITMCFHLYMWSLCANSSMIQS